MISDGTTGYVKCDDEQRQDKKFSGWDRMGMEMIKTRHLEVSKEEF